MLRQLRSVTARSLSGLVRRLRVDREAVLRCLRARGGRCIRRAPSQVVREVLADRVDDRELVVRGDRDRDSARGLGLAARDRGLRDFCLRDRRGHRPDVRLAADRSSVAADSATRSRRKAR